MRELEYNQCLYPSRDRLGKIACGFDKIFYPRVKSQISVSRVQENVLTIHFLHEYSCLVPPTASKYLVH